eukprot:TRINITY_DN313_c0_g2_i1.p1 TRINITY_DN313_c0_g2~~TRINITY_DN313_c0_g2_i1.p1  ORF type:complete len:783 (+),score=193.61 TRINITY_DN313_c0_g2_i1:56-2404(+)
MLRTGLSLLLLLCPACTGVSVVWQRPLNGGVIAVHSDDTYTVSIDGKCLLNSQPTMLHAGGAWLQDGSGLTRVSGSLVNGTDKNLGDWEGYSVKYTFGQSQRFETTFMRYTAHQLLVFEQYFPEGATQTNITNVESMTAGRLGFPEEFNSSTTPVATFPAFTVCDGFPIGVKTWGGRFAVYNATTVLAPEGSVGGPVVMHDVDAGALNGTAAVWSPFNNLKSNILGVKGNAAVAGLQGFITEIPAGTRSLSCMYFDYGITIAMHEFGKLLQLSVGRTAPKKRGLTSSKISYWTDNGAFYDWYHWGNVSADGTPEQVLKELHAQYVANDVPMAYYQLDAYWYPLVQSNANCKINDTAVTKFFPSGLQSLSETIGPLLLYSGPTCDVSTYWKENGGEWEAIYSLYYNRGWALGKLGNVHPDSSYAFYKQRFDVGVATQGMQNFEIDFLDFNYLLFPMFLTNLTASEDWLRGMATAAAEHDFSIQYCMALPSDFLVSVNFDAVTDARASQDYSPGWQGNYQIGGTALLLSSVGLSASKDNFWTSGNESDPSKQRTGSEPNAELIAIVSAMSGGPVGVADMLGMTNYSVIRPTFATDGTLLHGSRPLTPLESTFFKFSPGEYCYHTNSLIGTQNWYSVILSWSHDNYVLKPDDFYPRPSPDVQYVMYEWNSRCANGSALGECVKPLSSPVSSSKPAHGGQDAVTYLLVTVAEVKNGCAFFGEVGKYVMVSPDRFTQITHTAGGVRVTAEGTPNEVLHLAFLYLGKVVLRTAEIQADGSVTVTVGSP